jgi:hypothetical protein
MEDISSYKRVASACVAIKTALQSFVVMQMFYHEMVIVVRLAGYLENGT